MDAQSDLIWVGLIGGSRKSLLGKGNPTDPPKPPIFAPVGCGNCARHTVVFAPCCSIYLLFKLD
jgi:hypothetical protein